MNMKETRHTKFKITCAVLSVLLLSCILLLQPHDTVAATISCSNGLSGCHFKTNAALDGTARNTPDGFFPGTHARHSGYSTSATKRQYQYVCTKCHPSGGYTNSHQSGFKNITGSSVPKSKYSAGAALNGRIPNTNTPAFGNCTVYCHSSGRAMGQLQYSSVKWGGGTETCLGCHGGRSTTNPYPPVRSVGNFTLSTTHFQHLKYSYLSMNCQICHSKTATSATALKNYTGVTRHANGVRDVTFAPSLSYGSYTSYKSTEAGSLGTTKVCSNVSCHGGKSRNAWSAATTNNSNTCAHCHGIDGTTSGTDLRAFAPGFRKQGTSTDQVTSSNDLRVGSHFKHLSSVYMKNVKCNECHTVPTGPFDGTHMQTARYNSQTLIFSQSSSAVWDGAAGSKLSAFSGYTTGTPSKAATCSSVYCHGNRLKNGDTNGTYRKPYWNYSAMINYTQAANIVCAKCHGYPPTSNSHSTSTTCSTCHTNISATDNKTILNKSLHINRIVEAKSDCNICHGYDVSGGVWTSGLTGAVAETSHYKHIVFIKSRLGIANLTPAGQTYGTGEPMQVCGTCHTNTLSEHNNGSRQINFGSGTYVMGSGTANSMSLLFGASNPALATNVTRSNISCSNLMCHYATTPNWY